MNADALSAVFNCVDLQTLHISSQVSRLWRECARDHPNYWKNLVLDTLRMSAADIALFLDRLVAKQASHATIRLSLRCPPSTSQLNRLVFSSLVLPAVRAQIHRVEEVEFSFAPAFAGMLRSLFVMDAPLLRGIQIIVRGDGGALEPLPSLFRAHTHTCLEHVLLHNVPLSPDAYPLGHTLASLQATYNIYDGSDEASFERVLSWFPTARTLDLLPIDRRYRGKVPRLPNLSGLQFNALRHLMIYHERHLLGIPHHLVPVLSIYAPLKAPGQIHQLIPEKGELTLVCRVRMRSDLSYAVNGRVVVATVDGDRIRDIARVKVSRIVSLPFWNEIMGGDRLVSLTIPLAIGFRTLCEHAYFLPQLTTLRLVLNALPESVASWAPRAVLCPQLSTLILQREVEETEATISFPALETFVRAVIAVDVPDRVHVVLEGITLEGGEGRNCVECRPPRTPWDAVMHSSYRWEEPQWLCERPMPFGLGVLSAGQ